MFCPFGVGPWKRGGRKQRTRYKKKKYLNSMGIGGNYQDELFAAVGKSDEGGREAGLTGKCRTGGLVSYNVTELKATGILEDAL